jgi:hypothetical protein
MSGIEREYSLGIVTDVSGNIYTTGFFSGTVDFDPGSGFENLTSNGDYDIHICKLDSVGNFVWASNLGGLYTDFGRAIKVDASGNVYSVGMFTWVSDFDPSSGTHELTCAGSTDIYLHKISQGSTGISALTRKDIKIFPNPASETVYVFIPDLSGSAEIEIYDMLGVLTYKQPVETKETSIPMGPLTKGIYMMRIVENGQVISTQKLIKD